MTKRTAQKRGIALLWVLALSFVMMVVTGTMVSYMVKESKMSVNVEQSVQAYAYARSGIDWGLGYVEKENPVYPFTENIEVDGQSAITDIVVTLEKSVPENKVTITSTGNHMGTKRSLEYVVKPRDQVMIMPINPPQNTNLNTQIVPSSNSSSFQVQFDFWFSSTAIVTDEFLFGLSSAANNPALAGNNFVGLKAVGSNLYLKTSSGSEKLIDLSGDTSNKNKPFRYRAEIKYIKDTAVSLKIRKRGDDGLYSCIGGTAKKMNPSSDNLTYLYAKGPGSSSYVADGFGGDGVIKIDGSGASPFSMYVDNIVIFDKTIP